MMLTKANPTVGRAVRAAAIAGICLATVSCSALGLSSESSEKFPSKSIEYVVPYKPGGSSDPVARQFSRMVAEDLGTSSTVFNKPGGDEAIGITEVVDAEPDGHTLGLASAAGLLAQPLINDSLRYEGAEDVTPIVQMIDTPYVLFVAADSPYKTLDDLLADAKRRPGKVRIGTANRMGGTGFSYFALENEAGVDMTEVPAAGGSGESALAVMGGEIEAFLATGSGQLGLVESGDLRALAYTGTEYGNVLPDATSFEDAGYDVPFTADYFTVAPKGLPDNVREQLIESAKKVATSEEWIKWAKKQGNVPTAVVGDELEQALETKRKRFEAAIELANQEQG